jgi:hypothetical protein
LNLFAWLRPEKVDTNLFYQEELRNAGEKMESYRKTREDFPLLRSAFITFANPLAAHIACQTVIHTGSGYMTPRTMPLSVDDVVWSNVTIAWPDRTIRTVLSMLQATKGTPPLMKESGLNANRRPRQKVMITAGR